MSAAAELGFRTELIFHQADGEVRDLRARHGCRVIRTPSNPTYLWGNYLLFDHAPVLADVQRWPALFEELIAAVQPGCVHRAFGWIEDDGGAVDAFLRDGYTTNDGVVMQAREPPVVRPPEIGARLRPFAPHGADSKRDWSQFVGLAVATREPGLDEDLYRAFIGRRVERWRLLIAAGRGNWFGAFVDDAAVGPRLAAALGIFVEAQPLDGERLARYQSVMTDARFRRRGLCRALMALAARHARDDLRADRLVVVAAAGEMPEQLYAGLGFVRAGLQRGVQRQGS